MEIGAELRELRKLWSGFWISRILLTANNLGIFDQLRDARTAQEVAGLIETDARSTEILLNALTGLGLLRKKSGKFRNSGVANRFLAKGSRHYQGDIMRHADALWKNWSCLDEVVKKGAPAGKARDHESFIRGMHNIAVTRAAGVIGKLDLKGVGNALDLGGGPGTYSIELARKGIAVTLFDLPETLSISREIIGGSGVEGITCRGGDFLADEIGGGYDLVFISQVLHSLSPAENADLIRKCAKALRKGGKIAIQEFQIDNTFTKPLHGALFSVNMLVNTESGRCYSPKEIIQWLHGAGFRKCSSRALEDTVLLFGSV